MNNLNDHQKENCSIDLFDYPELIPDNISDLIEAVNTDNEPVAEAARLKIEFQKLGYTFEFDEYGIPFDLRKI